MPPPDTTVAKTGRLAFSLQAACRWSFGQLRPTKSPGGPCAGVAQGFGAADEHEGMSSAAAFSPDRTYRLVTRSDFDGLICAALLKELGVIDDILFVHPKD